MEPSTVKNILVLFYNYDLWDVYLVNKIEEEEAKSRGL